MLTTNQKSKIPSCLRAGRRPEAVPPVNEQHLQHRLQTSFLGSHSVLLLWYTGGTYVRGTCLFLWFCLIDGGLLTRRSIFCVSGVISTNDNSLSVDCPVFGPRCMDSCNRRCIYIVARQNNNSQMKNARHETKKKRGVVVCLQHSRLILHTWMVIRQIYICCDSSCAVMASAGTTSTTSTDSMAKTTTTTAENECEWHGYCVWLAEE